MSERKYFPINESSARTAHNMMSMRDYSEGSTTKLVEAFRKAGLVLEAMKELAEKAGGTV